MERRILKLEKECRQMKGTPQANMILVDRRLIEELNSKVKMLEEKLDHRVQLYEELEDKFEKQKDKHKENIWKLR